MFSHLDRFGEMNRTKNIFIPTELWINMASLHIYIHPSLPSRIQLFTKYRIWNKREQTGANRLTYVINNKCFVSFQRNFLSGLSRLFSPPPPVHAFVCGNQNRPSVRHGVSPRVESRPNGFRWACFAVEFIAVRLSRLRDTREEK